MHQHLRITDKGDYVIVHLDRGKVNAINHEMVSEIRSAFRELSGNAQNRGVIVTGKPHYFSAGLDLIELYDYSADEIAAFWTDFMGMMIDLTKFPKPLIAAISGYSPAGGAIIAITCDYRIMADGEKYHIGLNETAVGIPISENIFPLYSFWLGSRLAHQSLMEGRLFSAAEAKLYGLVDEVCSLEDLLPIAEQKMQGLLLANQGILLNAKYQMRKDLIKQVDIDMSADIQRRALAWVEPENREMIGKIVDRLTKKA